MNWDAIAAIAEGLGAVGVIATVVYLAFQIRQNTKSIQGSTQQSLMSQEMAMYALLSDHAGVYRRGCANLAELDSDEIAVFQNLVSAVQSQMYCAYVQYHKNLIPESLWTGYLNDWANNLKEPGFQLVWADIQNLYPDEFCKCIDDVKKSTLVAD